MSLLFAILLSATTITQTLQTYGPFYYPNGKNTDPISITFGAFNSTHFQLNIFITGEYWFGFGFASNSGCTKTSTSCSMLGTDSIIFAYYPGAQIPLTAKKFKLAYHNSETELSTEDIQLSITAKYTSKEHTYKYNANIIRPLNPQLHGDFDSYKFTYPLQGSFCWLWAQGNSMIFTDQSTHMNKGHECIQFESNFDYIDTDSNDTVDSETESTWLEDNLTWILMGAAFAVIVCFCCAFACFWYSQHKRTKKRREKRQNMLNAEKFKLEHGINIDSRNKSDKTTGRNACNDSDECDSETDAMNGKNVNNEKDKRHRKRKPRPVRKRTSTKESKKTADSNDNGESDNQWNDSEDCDSFEY